MEVQVMRSGSSSRAVEAISAISADLDEMRNGFHAEVEARSEALRAEIAVLKQGCLASITGVVGNFRRSSSTIFANESVVFWDFPAVFEDFKEQAFTLLWRGSRDGFDASDFHSHCDGHANILIVILDTKGNIFGGFTPLEWESDCGPKSDPTEKTFLFTLKNPHDSPARRFALRAEKKAFAIGCHRKFGPCIGDIMVNDNYNVASLNHTNRFGDNFDNDTGIDGDTFFTGSSDFQGNEIEVFEISA
jgi:hypothetical protein